MSFKLGAKNLNYFERSGSEGYAQQISKLVGCDLRRIGTLSFNIGSYQNCVTGTDKMLVCFD